MRGAASVTSEDASDNGVTGLMSELNGQALACRRGDRLIFRDLNLAVAAGGALLLRGPNGSGKSSLLRCLAGLLPLASGSLSWNGKAITPTDDGYRAGLRYVGHQDAIKPALTVAENLRIWATLYRSNGAAIAAASLDRLGLAGLDDVPARLLSAGQRRRLALARLALAFVPLWLLDEPTTGLDDDGTGRFLDLLGEHRRQGGLAILSSHGDPGVSGQELQMMSFRPAEIGAAA